MEDCREKRDFCLAEAEKIKNHYRGFRRNLGIIRQMADEKTGEDREICLAAVDMGEKNIKIRKNIYRLWMALSDSYQHLIVQEDLL